MYQSEGPASPKQLEKTRETQDVSVLRFNRYQSSPARDLRVAIVGLFLSPLLLPLGIGARYFGEMLLAEQDLTREWGLVSMLMKLLVAVVLWGLPMLLILGGLAMPILTAIWFTERPVKQDLRHQRERLARRFSFLAVVEVTTLGLATIYLMTVSLS